jgi:hypothetical protein
MKYAFVLKGSLFKRLLSFAAEYAETQARILSCSLSLSRKLQGIQFDLCKRL